MSHNAESRAKAIATNKAEWSATPEREKDAVRKAISAYAISPGDDSDLAMLRACRVYAKMMGEAR